jgi:adenine-specific DNA methylase
MPQHPLLIESWLPIEAIGAESQRERGASSALPPLYFLHVWWARRPLIASRAAILTSVLPQWSTDFPAGLYEKFPNKETYHAWVLQLMGIFGDSESARKLLVWAKQQERKISNPYGAPRAFTVNPSAEDLKTMGDLLEWTWGKRDLSVLDPFAGGGSIPFEALRYGFATYANDLNPVAAVILKATLDYPARFGPALAEDIRKWGKRWYELVKPKLQPYFTPLPPGVEGAAYLWARTVACPTTGKPVPLSPNWWLSTGDKPVAVRLIAEPHMEEPRFEIYHPSPRGRGVGGEGKPDEGTIARGVARSPWTGETIDGDYIKTEAQAGRMGQMLYAVAAKRRGGFDFRAPTEADREAVCAAEEALAHKKPGWIVQNIIPTEAFPSGNDNRPLMYGMPTWADFFSPRQLLAMGTFMETLHELELEIRSSPGMEKPQVIITYLAIALDKSTDYNSRLCPWHPFRQVLAHTFGRHDFSFTWSHGEFDAAGNLLPWTVKQIVDAYKGLADLISPSQQLFGKSAGLSPVERLSIVPGSATNLAHLPDASVDNITVDPPYLDNVQYAELSDFFYVWLKRSVGHLYPEFFRDELTNKDDEAVANPARFKDLTPGPSPKGRGGKARELAEQDYENKMSAAFREMYRVLRPDGSLTVMFTHKRVEAWDTLASALIGAGFAIKASWPVHTESEHSLHQAKKNAAASTILLVCRKREVISVQSSVSSGKPNTDNWSLNTGVWWDDIKETVRATARQKAAEFAAAGMHGVDLYISTFGPSLSIISEHWPVLTSEIDEKTGQPRPLRPETALDLAREEVIRLRKEGLLAGRDVRFDPVTDWTLMAWDAFAAAEFPYDEARKLAIALGVDMDKTIMASKRLAIKKSSSVVLQEPIKRRKKGMVDDEVLLFEHWIDAAHTAMMLYAEDGAGACDVFLRKSNLKNDATFKALIQSLINAIPRARIKGKFVRPEAEVLENMRLAFYPEMTVPVEEEPEMPVEKQLGLFEEGKGSESEEEENND